MGDFNLDISDRSIEGLRLKKSLLGKAGVASLGRVELEEGIVEHGEILDPQKLAEKISQLVKKGKVNFTLPDLRTFVCRIQLPSDIGRSAIGSFLKEKVVEIVPYDFEELIHDFKVLKETEKEKEVLFVGVAKKILAGYLKAFKILKLVPLVAVPESMAAFEIFKDTVVKDEVILYLDVGAQNSTLSFFDKFGPLLTFSEPAETKILKEEVKKAITFLKEEHGQEVKRVILGGGGSMELDAESFSKEIGVWTTKIDKILEAKLTKTGLNFKTENLPPTLFINVLGLALLSSRKEELNLAKDNKNLLEVLQEKEKEEEESKSKEKESELQGEEKEEKKIPEKAENQEDDKEKAKKEKEAESKDKIFPKKNLKPLLLIGVFALITFLGVYLFIKKPWVKKGGEEALPSLPTATPKAASSTVTPELNINRKDIKVKILNGSGMSGKAGEMASFLEDLGYQVIGTGNADTFDYEETVIKIKEEKRDVFSHLTNDLKSAYTVSSEEVILEKDEEADAVVIVGRE